MSLSKLYSEDGKSCTVFFSITESVADGATKMSIPGDFNEWNADALIMQHNMEDGTFSAQVDLESDRAYEFRYLADDSRWMNEPLADAHVRSRFVEAENSVIVV